MTLENARAIEQAATPEACAPIVMPASGNWWPVHRSNCEWMKFSRLCTCDVEQRKVARNKYLAYVRTAYPLALDVIEAAKVKHVPGRADAHSDGHWCKCGEFECAEMLALDAFEAAP